MFKYKTLKGYAHNIADKFSCSDTHFCYMAAELAVATVTIDLLNGKIEPLTFDIERNRILAQYCQDTLRSIVPLELQGAKLILNFEFNSSQRIVFGKYQVTLTDDKGREWLGSTVNHSVKLN